MTDTVYCYVASHPGVDGYCCATVDKPEWKSETAKATAKWIRDGLSVMRVTLEEARDGLAKYVPERDRQRELL